MVPRILTAPVIKLVFKLFYICTLGQGGIDLDIPFLPGYSSISSIANNNLHTVDKSATVYRNRIIYNSCDM